MFLYAVFRTNLQEMRFDDNRKDVEGGVIERWRDLALESDPWKVSGRLPH